MTEADALLFVVDDDERVRQSLKNLIGSVGLQVKSFPRLAGRVLIRLAQPRTQ